MLDRIKQLLAPPVFADDEDKTRIARLLNTLLLVFLAFTVTYSIVSIFALPTPELTVPIMGIVALLEVGALFLMRRGYVRVVSLLYSLVSWALVTGVSVFFGGVLGSTVFGYIVLTILAGLLLGGRGGFLVAGLSIAGGLGMTWAETNGLLPPPLSPNTPVTAWTSLSLYLVMAAAILHFATRDLNDALARARRYAAELEEQRERLEETVKERTRDLTRRTRYLETTATVARDVALELDLQGLLSHVVALISERFAFYHTGIFLLDPGDEWAELRAASSAGGQRMLARRHRLQVGAEGIVGHVAGSGVHRVALDVGEDAVFFDNMDLPETRSEIALPLRVRGKIIGVLDVQSRESEAFSQEDVAVLQVLADQVAMAISNAHLFQRIDESMEAERRIYQELSRESWQELLRTQLALGFLSDARDTVPAGDLWRPEMKVALNTGQTTPGEGATTMAVPIKVRGQVIGVVDGRKPQDAGEWTQEEIELLEALTDQLNVALEGARLYQDSQRRAVREQMTREITDKMRRAVNVEGILQTAVDELFSVLGTSRAFVRLGVAPPAQGDEENSE